VEDSQHADGAADEAAVVGKFDDRVGRSLDQQCVAAAVLATLAAP
jgi:hypothetical protein